MEILEKILYVVIGYGLGRVISILFSCSKSKTKRCKTCGAVWQVQTMGWKCPNAGRPGH